MQQYAVSAVPTKAGGKAPRFGLGGCLGGFVTFSILLPDAPHHIRYDYHIMLCASPSLR